MERVYADVPIEGLSNTFQSIPDFGRLVSVILFNALVFAAIIFFVLLVFGGFSVIMGAGGEAKQMEKGKNAITSAVIGLVLVVVAFWILQILEVITGVRITNPAITP